MQWNDHSNLKDCHAFLSPSKWHWINYDSNKLIDVFKNTLDIERGTKLHAFAADCIALRQNLPKSNKTLNQYVNDAIKYKMDPEQILYYSNYAYGTADSICYSDGYLRIHDLKTGKIPAHMEQVMIYEALFCLEYHVDPQTIKAELRIYQNDEVLCHVPDPMDILTIMNKIKESDAILRDMQKEG